VLRSLLHRAHDPLIIMPYLGFGTPKRLTLCGRVLQDEGIRPTAESDGRWRNAARFFKHLESDELPYARVKARLGTVEEEFVANKEGYFSVELVPTSPVQSGAWHTVALELVDHPGIKAIGEVLVPSATAQLGIISDIDDTVVQSDVVRKVRMLLTVAFSNARTRKPFEGVAAFYRALTDGGRPVFYVSKSPWNLYAPLVEFMDLQGIPRGPLMLRNLSPRMQKNHKQAAIENILRTYPGLKFVLIGDSGEQDPEIYSAAIRRFPERIRVVYIRSVDPSPARIAAIAKLAAEVAKTGCQLVLAPDSELAAAHAAGEGLIAPGALPGVRREKLADRTAPRIPSLPAAR
jgi:phosphatidate phosphatase APP1